MKLKQQWQRHTSSHLNIFYSIHLFLEIMTGCHYRNENKSINKEHKKKKKKKSELKEMNQCTTHIFLQLFECCSSIYELFR